MIEVKADAEVKMARRSTPEELVDYLNRLPRPFTLISVHLTGAPAVAFYMEGCSHMAVPAAAPQELAPKSKRTKRSE